MLRMSLKSVAGFVGARGRTVGAIALMALPGAAACAPRAPTPPPAEFLVATADSTFWVRTGAQGVRVRSVPMTIARFGGRFHEVFVADVDRSFSDAVFTGERVYVRDLQSGDSTLVYDDTAVVTLSARHARSHPDALPLNPDDDTPNDPEVTATGETDILEVRGPYVLLEHRSSFELVNGQQHDTVRTAVDLRTGRAATALEMARDSAALDTNFVRAVPKTWSRQGYTVLARSGSADGAMSLSLRDRALRAWPLISVGAHPRVYWLDSPPIDTRTRNALARAFDDAAAYDESVKYVRFVAPHTKKAIAHPTRRA